MRYIDIPRLVIPSNFIDRFFFIKENRPGKKVIRVRNEIH